jgi:hypothetical protein
MEGGDIIEEEEEEQQVHDQHGSKNIGLKSKKLSWKKIDSFDLEAARITSSSHEGHGSPQVRLKSHIS